jgi:cobalt ECF transporter T component CbiQ
VVLLSRLAHLPLSRLIARMTGPLVFVFLVSVGLLVLVPGARIASVGWLVVTDAGLLRFTSALGRGAVALGAAVVLVSTTTFPELLHALRQLRLPRTVTTALGLAYRLFYTVVDEVERLQRTARSRNLGSGAARRRTMAAGIAAAALTRSLARAERTYRAMLARGYRGDLLSLSHTTWDARAIAWAGSLGIVVVMAGIWARIG